MPAANTSQTNQNFSSRAFEDSDFGPQSGFDFAESIGEEMQQAQRNMPSLDMFSQNGDSSLDGMSQQNMQDLSSFDPFPVGSSAFGPGMASAMDYSNTTLPNNSFSAVNTGPQYPMSFQNEIVNMRRDSAAVKYGQVTPPEKTPEGQEEQNQTMGAVPEGSNTKLNKSERARNAANHRHAKSKLAREAKVAKLEAGSEDDDAVPASGGEVGVKREKYREKNRVAAAKCRAKKKENVEDLEEKHREFSAMNKWLKQQERQLRDELSNLRTCALQHTPGSQDCCCSELHQYNRNKASQVVYGLYAPVDSPASDMASNAVSEPNFGMPSRHNSFPTGAEDRAAQAFPRHHSFSAGNTIDFNPLSSSDAMMSLNLAAASEMDQTQFANFMQDPSGQGGFS